MNYLIAYLSTTIVFLAIDSLWLGIIAKDFYFKSLSHVILDRVNFGVAALFYLFYTIGIVVFAIKPAIESQNIWLAIGYSALFGFLAYGTYDFTNLATLKDWPVKMSIVDIIWGTSLTAFAGTMGYLITKHFS